MTKRITVSKKQVSPKGWDKVETSTEKTLDVSKMTKEQLVALLGDKYKIEPKVDESKISITLGEYKGKPTISIVRGAESFVNRPLTLGVAKAKLIVESIDAIKSFIKANA